MPSREPRSDAAYPHISGELTADASELEAVSAAPTFTSTTFTSSTSTYSISTSTTCTGDLRDDGGGGVRGARRLVRPPPPNLLTYE